MIARIILLAVIYTMPSCRRDNRPVNAEVEVSKSQIYVDENIVCGWKGKGSRKACICVHRNFGYIIEAWYKACEE